LLASGVPLAPVMAFWLASPLMDPEMFILLSATLGLPFTIAKTVAAVAMGVFGGATCVQPAALTSKPTQHSAVRKPNTACIWPKSARHCRVVPWRSWWISPTDFKCLR